MFYAALGDEKTEQKEQKKRKEERGERGRSQQSSRAAESGGQQRAESREQTTHLVHRLEVREEAVLVRPHMVPARRPRRHCKIPHMYITHACHQLPLPFPVRVFTVYFSAVSYRATRTTPCAAGRVGQAGAGPGCAPLPAAVVLRRRPGAAP